MRTLKTFILTGVFSFQILLAQAQDQPYIDSLLNVIETQNISDKEKVDSYNNIANKYGGVDSLNTVTYVNLAKELAQKIAYDEGIIDASQNMAWLFATLGYEQEAKDLYNETLKKSIKLNYTEGNAKLYHGLSVLYFYSDNYDLALQYAERALSAAKEINNARLISLELNVLGMVYSTIGDNNKALEYHFKSLENAKGRQDKLADSHVLNNIGGIYLSEGNYSKGLDYMLRSLKLVEEMGNMQEAAVNYVNIALIYNLQGDNKKALEYLFKAIEIWEENKYTYGLGHVYNAIGTIYHELGSNEESLEYFFKSNALNEEVGNINGLADSYRIIGLIYQSLEDYPKAVEHANKSLKLSQEIGHKEYEAKALIILGKIYCKMGSFSKARSYLNDGIFISKAIKLPSAHRDGLEQLAVVEENFGNYREAYRTHQQFKLLEDSLLNEQNTKELTRLEAEYIFEQEKDSIKFANDQELFEKNTEIELLAAREDLANLRLIIGTVLVIVIIAIILLMAKQKLQSRERKARELAIIGQFKESMTSMIAHDLKNPLGVILGTESEIPSTQNMAKQMLGLVNNMLDVQKFEKAAVKLNLQCVALEKVVREAIAQVQNLCKEKNIQIISDIDENITVKVDEEIFQRVLINLFTNAIKYSPNNEQIEIRAILDNDRMLITVKDHGKGIPESQLQNIFNAYQQIDPRQSGPVGSTGLGLTFCRLALEAHGSKIMVESKIGQGTTFSFHLDQTSDDAAIAVLQNDQNALILSENDQKQIQELLPTLRSFKMHEAMKVEALLIPIKDNSEATKSWVEAVINAVYNGNEEYLEELMDQVE